MGYIHDKLKEALGGNKVMDSKNTAIRDWTPNNVKVLIISRNYILVLYHVGGFGGSRVVNLDIGQVEADLNRLARNGGSPKLNTILKRRSFSCMEEIYVDYAYLSNPPIIDLLGYVKDLVGTSSRLRYFGYGEFPLGSEEKVKSLYHNNKRNLDYSLATDSDRGIRLEFRDVGNTNWYKNYYLRPKYYKLDDEKGKLSIHFRKFEDDYETYLSNKDKANSERELEEKLKYIASIDISNISYLKRFDSLLYHLAKGTDDNIKSTVFKICKGCIRSKGIFKGLSTSLASNILGSNSDKDYLLKSYERFGVIDKENNTLDINKVDDYIKEGKGFIDLNYILDVLCTDSIKALSNKGYKDLVGMALIMAERDIPQGAVRDNFIKKQSKGSNLEGYFILLSELTGVIL